MYRRHGATETDSWEVSAQLSLQTAAGRRGGQCAHYCIQEPMRAEGSNFILHYDNIIGISLPPSLPPSLPVYTPLPPSLWNGLRTSSRLRVMFVLVSFRLWFTGSGNSSNSELLHLPSQSSHMTSHDLLVSYNIIIVHTYSTINITIVYSPN